MSDPRVEGEGSEKTNRSEAQGTSKKGIGGFLLLLGILAFVVLGYIFREQPGKLRYPRGSQVTIHIPPGAPQDFQRLQATLLTDVSELPGLDEENPLISAARLEPAGSTFPSGVEVTWPIAKRRDLGRSKNMHIVHFNEDVQRWQWTGAYARVDEETRTATGPVFHFSVTGLTKSALSEQEPTDLARPTKLHIPGAGATLASRSVDPSGEPRETHMLGLTATGKLGRIQTDAIDFQPFPLGDEHIYHFEIASTGDLLYVTMVDGPDGEGRTPYDSHFRLWVSGPEGDSPVLISDRVGDANIFFEQWADGKRTEMFPQCGGPMYPHWSRDGESILFIGWRDEKGGFPVYLADVATKSVKPIIHIPPPTEVFADGRALAEIMTDSPFPMQWLQQFPFFSVDGDKENIGLQWTEPIRNRGRTPLYTTDPVTGFPVLNTRGTAGSQQMSDDPVAVVWYGANVRFHPDGESLTWTSNARAENRSLWVAPIDEIKGSPGSLQGEGRQFKTADEFLWAPNGEQVALIRRYRDEGERVGHQLLVLDRTTGEERLLYHDPPHEFSQVSWLRSMSWSPDSSKLAVFLHSKEHSHQYRIYDVTLPDNRPLAVIPDVYILEPQLPLASRRFTTFSPDNRIFYYIGFTTRDLSVLADTLVTVILPEEPVEVLDENLIRRETVLGPKMGLELIAMAAPLSEECESLRMVVPSRAKDWVFEEVGDDAQKDPKRLEKRDRLLDAANRLPDIRTDYAATNRALQKLLLKANPDLKERQRLEEKMRSLETAYLRAVSPLVASFSDAEDQALRNSYLRRVDCLTERAAEALDKTRAANYVSSWEAFTEAYQEYEFLHDSLVHSLNGFQTLNAMRLLRAQQRLSLARTPFARKGLLGSNSANKGLEPYQTAVRDLYLDMGRVSIQLSQAQLEAGILEQDSYLAGVWAVNNQAKNLELAKTRRWQAAQTSIFTLKYMLAGGMSILGAGLDRVKQVYNLIPESYTGDMRADTLTIQINRQLKESREKAQMAVNTLERIRGYSPKQTSDLMLRNWKDEGLAYLTNHRIFHEQTSGGLRRIASSYISEIPRLMEEELLMAQEHAELAVHDMEQAFNARIGADAKGEFSRFKSLLTNPVGTARVAIQDTEWGGDHFTSTRVHITERKGQIQNMDTVRRAMVQVGFETVQRGSQRDGFDPLALAMYLPENYGLYLELEKNNPDFLQWTLNRDRLAMQQRIDVIDRTIELEFEPDRRAELEQIKLNNRIYLTHQLAQKQSRLFLLQGIDQMIVWDYDGALESFRQAVEAVDPDLKRTKEGLRKMIADLQEILVKQKTIDAGIEAATHLGNMAVHTAMFEAAGRAIGGSLEMVPARWTGKLSFSDFADFVWRQFNPFSDVLNAAIVKREWRQLAAASGGVGLITGITVVQQEAIKRGLLVGYFGMDEEWADFLALGLVSVPQARTARGNSLMYELAVHLGSLKHNFAFTRPNVTLWNTRQDARRSLSDQYFFLDALLRFHEEQSKLSKKGLKNAGAEAITKATGKLQELYFAVHQLLWPITKESLVERYEMLFPPDGPKPGSPERLANIAKFFNGLDWKRHIMKLKLPKDDPFNRKIDNLRREIIAMAQVKFFNDSRYSKYKEYLIAYLYIGSAGKKDSPAYKLTDSDIDFTAMVKADTPESVRNSLRDDFMLYFQEFAKGKDLEGYEMSMMVDPMPQFYPTGESIEGILHLVSQERNLNVRSANRAKLKAGIEKTLEQLILNASDKERYLDRGNLFRHNLFVRLGCYLKKAEIKKTEDGVELVNESTSKFDELYGNVPLEPWMAFDAVAGNLGYVFQHAIEKANDVVHHQKQFGGKYAIRGPLYALMLLSPEGRQKMKSLTRAEIEARGWEGAERIVVELAKEVLNQKDGMKKLGLPTTLTLRGKSKPFHMDKAAWNRLFNEWIDRKEGLPLEQVFGNSRGEKLKKGDSRVDQYLVENLWKTEACFKVALRKSILVQGADLMTLRNAQKDARAKGDTEAALIYELKLKEILLSQAAVWNRLGKANQNIILKELPSQADWWVSIAAVDKMRETIGKPAPTKTHPERVLLDEGALRSLRTRELLEENPEDMRRRIATMQERARTSPESEILFYGVRIVDDPSLVAQAATGSGEESEIPTVEPTPSSTVDQQLQMDAEGADRAVAAAPSTAAAPGAGALPRADALPAQPSPEADAAAPPERIAALPAPGPGSSAGATASDARAAAPRAAPQAAPAPPSTPSRRSPPVVEVSDDGTEMIVIEEGTTDDELGELLAEMLLQEIEKERLGEQAEADAEVQALIGRLKHPDSTERVQAAMAIAEYGMAGVPAIPALIEALGDPESSVRMAAAIGIGGIGAEDETAQAVPALIRALEDPSPVVRVEAARTIGEVAFTGSQEDAIVTALRKARKDEDARVREAAAESLDYLGY